MSDQRATNGDQTAAEDLQVLSNVLEDTPASDVTRRRLLQTAAVGAAASAGALEHGGWRRCGGGGVAEGDPLDARDR